MRPPPSTARRLVLVVTSLFVALAWFAWLRPTTLGGSASYVVVQGQSMEPTYDDGDLVLVREEARYRHGDVIAFRAGGPFDDPTRIIHRIVGDTVDGAFTTQGDNRDQLDPWQPGPDDIIGRAVLHVPMAGDLARLLTRPETFAALGAGAVVLGGERRRRRRRRARTLPAASERTVSGPEHGHRPTRLRRPPGPRWERATHPRWAFVGLVTTSLLAAPVLALTWSALRAPDSTERTERIGQIESHIGIDYVFEGEPSAVYPRGRVGAAPNAAGAVVPSDPLYSQLLDRLEAELTFAVEAEGADAVTSHHSLRVDVETPGGWSTTIETVEPARFDGTAPQSVVVDLADVAQQVADVAELTGVGGEVHTISITPRLDVTGRSAAGAIDEALTAPLTFTVEGNLITPNVIEMSDTVPLQRTVDERARYAIGPVELGTQMARGLLGGLALVLVAGMAWFASVVFGGVGLGEPDRIAARYRSQMVDVAAAAAPPGPVVMVSAIDELARIAKVEQSVILHEDLGDGAHRYRVFLGNVTYEYEAAPEHAGSAAPGHIATATDDGGG